MRTSPDRIEQLAPHEVFVFGSNASGAHGGGAARLAQERFGAVPGEGHGLHGQSYAIDTMSGLPTIEREVAAFLAFAAAHPGTDFLVTELGCGIAGHEPSEIAPLLADAGENVLLPARFRAILDA
ncbi:hypothetical protein OVA14_01980 [Agrococcus sp. SL85]|uniref:A1S_2505 family phage non-structural protein n=1 Tax=Agrococcus sp. SL85 TaxID=2995141 RepID=UPI00226D2CBE|nr:hypothetical protein [Agrococcus sp. SL85]WAC66576.1 hypothetical protein OVA14_01980 [Agrococcus sp. SL85]